MALPSSPASPYDRVVLIHNPESSGDATGRAEEFRDELAEAAPHLAVTTVPTEYAGHAREIALAHARRGRVLVISVSGDGGYREVVEGVMAAGDGRVAGATAAVLPAGNANDHRRATRERPLLAAVAGGRLDHLDLLRVQVGEDAGAHGPRWAHSYLGLGITPAVALALESGGKGGRLREIVTTVRAFRHAVPVRLDVEGRGPAELDSLVLANTREMAKYMTLSDGEPDDGVFEVVAVPHRSTPRLLAHAVRAVVRGLGPQPRATRYAFTPASTVPMQLDGDVVEVAAGQKVVVEVAPGALPTVR